MSGAAGQFLFASAAQVDREFWLSVFSSALIIGAIGVGAYVALRGRPMPISRRLAAAIGAVAFAGLVLFDYLAGYNRFISASVDAAGITLTYAGPFAHPVLLPLEQIGSVQPASAGKSLYQCHISVTTTAGRPYRSVDLSGRANLCKDMRDDIMAALAPARGH